MNKNTILVGVIALLIGIIGTNMYYANTVSGARVTQGMSGMGNGMHMMSDGTMMGNGMMDSMMDGMLANMKRKSGKELEKAFLVDMVPHHQGAVNMAKLLLQDKSVRPELVKFANEIITAQEREIEQMNEWLKNY